MWRGGGGGATIADVAVDERLVARVREVLAGRPGVTERRMFGGVAFMLAGNMCCGVNRDELMVRIDPDREDGALGRPHARPMDMTGRRMRGFVTVRPEGLVGDDLRAWVERGVERAESLPPR